jgi:hypothetical protein
MKINIQNIWDNWETHLEVDAMYFHAARQAHERAKRKVTDVQSVENRFASLNKEYNDVEEEHGDDFHSAYDELEPIAIQLSNAHDELGFVYAPLLKEVAVVHILSAASLEAHINVFAKDFLRGKDLKDFQGFNLSAKWLFLPRLAGLLGFKSDQQPFQGFSKLLKLRNRLVHYKGIKEKWAYGVAPQFIVNLGLTVQNSQESIDTVDSMVRNLAQQRDVEVPYWLRKDQDDTDYFKLIDKGEHGY